MIIIHYQKDKARYEELSKKEELDDNETKEFNELSRKLITVRDGKLGEHIGYAPLFRSGEEGDELDLEKGIDYNLADKGLGQMGKIMLDFQWNSMRASQGWAKLSLPMYDQPLWKNNGSFFEPPTLRSVSSVVMEIVGTAVGQSWWLSYADDLLFAAMDVGGGYKSASEVGLELAKTAATAAIGAGMGAASNALGDIAGNALQGASKFTNFAAQAGISMTTNYVTSVANSAVQSLYIEDGKLGFKTEDFTKSLYSANTISGALGAGITAGLNATTIGYNNQYVTGFNSQQIGNIQSLNSLVGGLATNATSLLMGGNANFNLLSYKGVGMLEFSFGKDGISSKIGMGGTNISYQNLVSAFGGATHLHVKRQIDNTEYDKTTQDALKSQYGYGDEQAKAQLDDIINGDTVLKFDAEGSEVAQSVTENGQKIIHINSTLNDGFIDLGLTLQHEAHRDGIVGDEQSQQIETTNAVLGHTVMAKKMQNDSLYKSMMNDIIDNNQNLQNDLAVFDYAVETGDWGAFGSYVNAAYDSSADYWLLKVDGTMVWDDSKDLNAEYYDEWGNLKTEKVVEADKNSTYAGTLAEYVGEERAAQILAENHKEIDDAGIYSTTALMDVLGVSEEEAIKMQHNGKLPSNITSEQRQRLIGEALMANGGMTWDGQNRGNINVFSLAMTDDPTIGQVVINPIYDSNNNITGYDRFGITALVIRDIMSYESTRNRPNDSNYDSYQGLDFMYYAKKDLNGNILDDFYSTGWQTVSNGYKNTYIPKGNNEYAFDSGDVYRKDTVAKDSYFNIRVGDFTSSDYEGPIFIISDFTTLGGLTYGAGSSENGRTLVHSDVNLVFNEDNNKYEPITYVGGKISAACFINTPEEIYDIQNNLKNWGVTYPYNVKSIIRNMKYD